MNKLNKSTVISYLTTVCLVVVGLGVMALIHSIYTVIGGLS